MQVGVKPLNPEVFFKKLRKPLDDRFLLFRAVAAAKAGDGRQDLVNIRAGRFERTVAECIGNKAFRLRGLQLFFRDDLFQLLLFLLLHIALPVAVNIRCSADGVDKAVNQVFFAAQLDAGVNRPVDGSKDAFILAVRFMVLHDQHQDIINVDLHLPDELDLKGNIIVDILFVSIRFRAIRLIKIEIHALVRTYAKHLATGISFSCGEVFFILEVDYNLSNCSVWMCCYFIKQNNILAPWKYSA